MLVNGLYNQQLKYKNFQTLMLLKSKDSKRLKDENMIKSSWLASWYNYQETK